MKKLFLYALVLILSEPVFGKTISIVGSPSLSFQFSEGQVNVEGEFELSNFGDEAAIEVFPEIEIGKWRWAGNPVKLMPQARNRWSLAAQVDLKDFACRKDTCVDNPLPQSGLFPILVWRHYKDLNGYPFSALTVERAIIGGVPEDRQNLLYSSPLKQIVKVKSNGEAFVAEVTIYNSGSTEIEGVLSLFTTREVLIETKPMAITLDPQSQKTFDLEGKNISGLLGSVYQVYSVLEYRDGEFRNASIGNAAWTIQEAETTNIWIFTILGFLIIGIIAVLYLRVF
ncbi:MAG: hypothetical protein KDD25_07180 [Bdellovibrionales bacterium]|nr:hypothetical protein [Bdellovibrionales bacterium]